MVVKTVKSRKITHTTSPEETRRSGAKFACSLMPGAVVAMHGDLGSGKTTFVQGMVEGLEIDDQATSPTFSLIHEYGRPPELYHFDCYRETSLERWQQLGLDEYFNGNGITVIEWAENIASLLPGDAIHLTFSHGPKENQRIIQVQS